MGDGAAFPPPEGDEELRRRAALWTWWRRAGLALLLAVVLVVLIAGVVGDLLPGPNGGIVGGGPEPTPTITVAPTPSSTSASSPSASPTSPGGGSNNGGGGGGGSNSGGNGGSGGGGGSNNGGNGGSGGGNGGRPTPTPTPTRTTTPTPTPTSTPTLPPTGPNRCTVPGGAAGPPNSCDTRQRITATVAAGKLSFSNTAGLTSLSTSGEVVRMGLATALFGQPVVGGQLSPVIVTDERGVDTGWTLTANLALVGGVPNGVIMTIDPWCDGIGELTAPGASAGPPGQSLGSTVVLCTKDDETGWSGSTGGVYQVGGDVSVAAWRGSPVPVTALVLTLTLA